jgi:hypothetical protein
VSAEASDRTRRGAEVSVAPLKVARDPATSADQLRALRTVYAPELDRLLARLRTRYRYWGAFMAARRAYRQSPSSFTRTSNA